VVVECPFCGQQERHRAEVGHYAALCGLGTFRVVVRVGGAE
jgi:hypothetical protein